MFRQRVAKTMEVLNNSMNFTVKNHIALRHHKEPVGGLKNPVTGLMDCKHHSSLPGDSHVRQDLHHVEGGGAVKPRRRFI